MINFHRKVENQILQTAIFKALVILNTELLKKY